MSKVIQILGVPTDVHDALVEAANAQGQSLTGYLLRELENVAKRAHAVQDNARIIRQTQELVAPHLIDSEVTHVLRGLVHRGVLTGTQGNLALDGFGRLIMARFPAISLRSRMWELRHNLGAYVATYIALTEKIEASALLTTDARLAHAPASDATSRCCEALTGAVPARASPACARTARA